mgnify:CR=1 FL=1
MNPGCWEVKWDFRDDCVAALMVSPGFSVRLPLFNGIPKALRRVPHLTVTWAHQPSYSGWESRYSHYDNQAFQLNCMLQPPFPMSPSFDASFASMHNSPRSPGVLIQKSPLMVGDSSTHEQTAQLTHGSRTDFIQLPFTGPNGWR